MASEVLLQLLGTKNALSTPSFESAQPKALGTCHPNILPNLFVRAAGPCPAWNFATNEAEKKAEVLWVKQSGARTDFFGSVARLGSVDHSKRGMRPECKSHREQLQASCFCRRAVCFNCGCTVAGMAESCLASVFFRPKIWACEKNHLLQKMAQGSSTFDLRAVKLENYFVPFKTGQEPGRAGPLWGKELMLLVLHLFGNTSLCAGVAAKRTFEVN